MSPTLFRGFVLASILLMIAAGEVDVLFPSLVPKPFADALEGQPLPDFLENHRYLSAAILIPWVIAAWAGTVGLLFFKRWARTLSVYTTFIGFALYPFLGSTVSSGLGFAMSEVSSVFWGAVLALSYNSPIGERFVIQS